MFTSSVIASLSALQDTKFPAHSEDNSAMLLLLGLLLAVVALSAVIAASRNREQDEVRFDDDLPAQDVDSWLEVDQSNTDLSEASAPLPHPEELEELIEYFPSRREEFRKELREIRKRRVHTVEMICGD